MRWPPKYPIGVHGVVEAITNCAMCMSSTGISTAVLRVEQAKLFRFRIDKLNLDLCSIVL